MAHRTPEAEETWHCILCKWRQACLVLNVLDAQFAFADQPPDLVFGFFTCYFARCHGKKNLSKNRMLKNG